MTSFAKQVSSYTPSGTPRVPQAKKFVLDFISPNQEIEIMIGEASVSDYLHPQTVIIDNTQGGGLLTLIVNGVNYNTPVGATNTFSILPCDNPEIFATMTQAGKATVVFSNVRIPSSSTGTFNEDGSSNVEIINPESIPVSQESYSNSSALSNLSGSIGTAATSQVVQASQSRKFIYLLNTSSDDMYVNFGGEASGTSIPLGSDALIFDGVFVPSDSINIFSGTAGATFICFIA